MRRPGRWACVGLALLGMAALNVGGCPAPKFNEMIPNVTLDQISAIQKDKGMTTAQKTQALNDLGITDPQLIHVLLNAPIPSATTTTGAAGFAG